MVAAGLGLLLVGGESLVRGAADLARAFGVSALIIGLTIVGFGTSTPELVTSLQAAFAGSPAIAVGNVVGSNTANILLIVGLAALMAPMAVSRRDFQRDGAVLVAITALAAVFIASGDIGRTGGLILVAALVGYLALLALVARNGAAVVPEGDAVDPSGFSMPWAVAAMVGGIALTILGARLLVDGAIDLARILGVSEAVIGVTIVAIGTSLPELVTSVMAARRGESDIAFGNVVGSNIFNIAGILGVTALVHPLSVPAEIATRDLWVMLAATAALIAVTVVSWRIGRVSGGAMLAAFVVYLGVLAVNAA